jgi:hypothetical protein
LSACLGLSAIFRNAIRTLQTGSADFYSLLIAVKEIRIMYPDVDKIINDENIFVCKLALKHVFS